MKIRKKILVSIILSFALHSYQAIATNDATHEINALDQENHYREDITEQVVLSNFATLVQCFFSIVQNPHNAMHVGANIAQMLAGIVNVAVEIMKGMPVNANQEDRTLFIKNIELSLKESLRTLAKAKKSYLKAQTIL